MRDSGITNCWKEIGQDTPKTRVHLRVAILGGSDLGAKEIRSASATEGYSAVGGALPIND